MRHSPSPTNRYLIEVSARPRVDPRLGMHPEMSRLDLRAITRRSADETVRSIGTGRVEKTETFSSILHHEKRI